MQVKSTVLTVPAARGDEAIEHFAGKMKFETDCWDVHNAIDNDVKDFVILDVRSQKLFESGHVPTAVSLPHPRINTSTLPGLPDGHAYVVYCAGPHCNGANKAALRIAKLGLPVKEMIGGIEGWKDEGFSLAIGTGD